jgi:hypothetical protein
VVREVDLARLSPWVKRAQSDWWVKRAQSDWRATVTLGCPRLSKCTNMTIHRKALEEHLKGDLKAKERPSANNTFS